MARGLSTLFFLLLALPLPSWSVEPIKAVVVTMFERAHGRYPWGRQRWVEKFLPREHAFPAGPFPLFSNDEGVLAVCTGGGIANATATIMALGQDPIDRRRPGWWLASPAAIRKIRPWLRGVGRARGRRGSAL